MSTFGKIYAAVVVIIIFMSGNAIAETKYIIAEACSPTFTAFKQSNQVSPEEFLRVQQRKDEIGKAAERKVLEFEKERLSEFPVLAERIEHIALKDVAAGYDIKSFDPKPTESGDAIPRFIEVKAVSLCDYRFVWTINEIEKWVRITGTPCYQNSCGFRSFSKISDIVYCRSHSISLRGEVVNRGC